MRATHNNSNNWVGAVNNNNKKRGALLAVHRSSHSHSHCCCYSLSSGPHRHATLTSTRAPPAQVVRHALPLRHNVRHLLPQSSSSVTSTSLTIAGTPRPRNTHSTTTSCRLSSTIMSATSNTYWRTCSMRCNHTRIRLAVMYCVSWSSFSKPSHPLNPRLGCCERLPSGATCVEEANVRKQRPPSLHHTSPQPSLSRTPTRAVSWGREDRRTAHARGHMQ
ncbi:hypothetical protein TcCL_Unassigned05027 [Trypanosoma cruzi]|nr:hypothetical protein TcCL_Unassigned05027 [Trypanosoma cruzi]